MVSDTKVKDIVEAKFGSGRLLKELLEYDCHEQSKFIFIGDPCQLPPVEGDSSPALEAEDIQDNFGYKAHSAELTQIMRQDNANDIISTAAHIRELFSKAPINNGEYRDKHAWGKLPFAGKRDIILHSSPIDLLNSYLRAVQKKSHENTIYIAQTNRQCRDVCNRVRERRGFKESLCVGDLLMVMQNQHTTGLMNGDFVEVLEIGKSIYKTFGHSNSTLAFQEVRLRENFTKREYSTMLIIECLIQGNLNAIQQSELFLDFAIRVKKLGITQKKDNAAFNEMLSKDPFLNALRCSYGYAVTCHKAQGGEWSDVYVDIPRNFMLNPTKATYQWIYTALTRAKETFHCVEDFYIN